MTPGSTVKMRMAMMCQNRANIAGKTPRRQRQRPGKSIILTAHGRKTSVQWKILIEEEANDVKYR